MTLELIKGPVPNLSVGNQLLTLANDAICATFLIDFFLVVQSPNTRLQLAAVVFIIVTDRTSGSFSEMTLCRMMWLLELLVINIAPDALVFGFQ